MEGCTEGEPRSGLSGWFSLDFFSMIFPILFVHSYTEF